MTRVESISAEAGSSIQSYSNSDLKSSRLASTTPVQKITEILKTSFDALSHAYKSGTALMLHDLMSHTVEATKGIHQSVKLSEMLGDTGKALSIGSAPLAVQGAYKGFSRIFIKPDASNKIDGALTAIKSVGSLSKTATKVIKVANQFGWASLEALRWASTINLVGMVLSVAGLLSVAKNWAQAANFQSQFGLDKEHNDYNQAISHLLTTEGNGLKRHLQISRSKLDEKIKTMTAQKTSDSQSIDETHKRIFEALKGRIASRISSHRLTFMSTAIGLTGAAILLATPGAPLMYAALTLGSLITMNKVFVEKNSDREFNRFFDLVYN